MLAAGVRAAKGVVKLKGYAGEITRIFQQGKQGEEDRHRRQHDRYHGGEYAPRAIRQQRNDKGRQTNGRQRTGDRLGQGK